MGVREVAEPRESGLGSPKDGSSVAGLGGANTMVESAMEEDEGEFGAY